MMPNPCEKIKDLVFEDVGLERLSGDNLRVVTFLGGGDIGTIFTPFSMCSTF